MVPHEQCTIWALSSISGKIFPLYNNLQSPLIFGCLSFTIAEHNWFQHLRAPLQWWFSQHQISSASWLVTRHQRYKFLWYLHWNLINGHRSLTYMWPDLRKDVFHAHNSKTHFSPSNDSCIPWLTIQASIDAESYLGCFCCGLFLRRVRRPQVLGSRSNGCISPWQADSRL